MRFVHRKIEENENWGSRKSRGFGLTWGVLIPFVWMWEHDENAFLLVASREEAAVDSAKNPDSLMKKLDYHIARLPQWYRDLVIPGYETRTGTKFRNFKAMQNPLTDGVIIGESTKGDLARGGRKTAGFIDEAAAVQTLTEIMASVSEVTYSMGFISTDLGLANPFARLWQGNSIEFFEAPEGAEWQSNPFWLGYTSKETGELVEGQTYKCTPDCPLKHHSGGGHDHSDRYDAFCKRVNWDSAIVAQELDREPSVAGGSVFDVVRVKRAMDLVMERIQDGLIKLTNHTLEFVQPANIPNFPGGDEEFYRERGTWPVRVKDDQFGPLQIWKAPFSCRDPKCICGGTGKHVYCLGVDTSSGYATSDGCGALVLDCTLGAIVAKLYGRFHATALAEEVVKLAKFYGTSSGDDIDAWTIIEANHEGATVNRICSQHGLFLHKNLDVHKLKGVKGDRLGVFVGTNKNALLAENIEAVINGGPGDYPQLVIPFIEVLEQFLMFIEVAPNTVDVKAEKTKKAAQKGAKDDLVMMANHVVYGAKCRYLSYRAVLRPDEERSSPVQFTLDTPKHFAPQSVREWQSRESQPPVVIM